MLLGQLNEIADAAGTRIKEECNAWKKDSRGNHAHLD
jgi:hypothetical protein